MLLDCNLTGGNYLQPVSCFVDSGVSADAEAHFYAGMPSKV